MTPSRILTGVLVSILLAGHAEPREAKKREATEVTQAELTQAAAKYGGKLVRVEGVVRDVAAPVEVAGKFRYMMHLEAKTLSVVCSGKPTVKKGDRVRVTGMFTHIEFSLLPRLVSADAGVGGKVEKLAPEKP